MAQGASVDPAWQLSRTDLRRTYDSYISIVEKDAQKMIQLTDKEKLYIPEQVVQSRIKAFEDAKRVNAAFVEKVLSSLPADKPMISTDRVMADEGQEHKKRQALELTHYPGIRLGSQSYNTMGSVLLHIFRDWSEECTHVVRDVYAPIVEQVKLRLPCQSRAPSILIPGSGLSRLAFELKGAGYAVECNEFSKIFATFANYLFNDCETSSNICPLSHVFSENWKLADQYMQVNIPTKFPSQASFASPIRMTTGDFVSLYNAKDGPAHRKFDCVVTCFFIDTCDDLIDYIQTIDSLLVEGGLWINLGPLNYKKELRLKLTWDEMEQVWIQLGYRFLDVRKLHTAYHLASGIKMYTEQYDPVLSVALKESK
uniref:carnosine N-methyltransferase n=2 Tax=Guillardia theta TaxID=55529 RepID=A0A6U6D067_GUITH|mmetsp:Transcript_50540/g.157801  ORF Transcript_50540/g.157801 Transcript_50540/m.157801 type:complete len:369 (+) Transcript_50540:1545-2651(+)